MRAHHALWLVLLSLSLTGTVSAAPPVVFVIGDPPWIKPHCAGGSRDGLPCLFPSGDGITHTGTIAPPAGDECPGGRCTPGGPPPSDWHENPPPGVTYVDIVEEGQEIVAPANADGTCPGAATQGQGTDPDALYSLELEIESPGENPDPGGLCHYTVTKFKQRRFPVPAKRHH